MSDERSGAGQGVAFAAFALMVAYAGVTVAGLLALPAPDEPIADPYFTAMEVLILVLAPVLIALMLVIHAWAAPARKSYALAAVVFMAITSAITSVVHFSVLTLSRAPEFAAYQAMLTFRWPSLAYALDILAWDVFFALAAMCAAMALSGDGLAAWTRRLFMASGAVSAIGLFGVALSDMTVRAIGVVGYALIFPAGIVCFAMLLRRGKA